MELTLHQRQQLVVYLLVAVVVNLMEPHVNPVIRGIFLRQEHVCDVHPTQSQELDFANVSFVELDINLTRII